MRIRKKSLLVFMLVIELLASIQFFYQISFNKLMLLGIALISYVLCLFAYQRELREINRDGKFVKFYSTTALGSICFVFAFSVLTYRAQGVMGTLYASYSYFTMILVVPFLCLIISEGERKLFSVLNTISVIWCLMIIAQSILYPINGQIIIPTYFTNNVILREGTIRISLTWIGNLMILYNFYRFYFCNRLKLKSAFFEFLIGLYGLVFIQKTRMYLITLFIGIIVMIWLERGSGNTRIKKICFLSCILGIIYASGVADTVLGSFSLTSNEASSTIARMNGMEYYWGAFLSNPIFGHGFVNDAFYPSIVRGPLGVAYYDDLGVVAQLARTGVFFVFIYIIPVLHMVHVVYRMKYNMERTSFILYAGLIVYILLTSGSLILLDSQRCLAMPIMVALFEMQNITMRRKLREANGVL